MAVFSEAHQRRYRYGYCGCPTGGCRQNRYIWKQCSAYGADIITPHLPQAASSPQAPQGEDTGVQTKFCTNIAQSPGMRNAMVYSNVPNRDTGKFSAALALREATTVSSATSTPGYRKVQCRTCVTRGSHGFLRTLEPGHRNMRIRRCVNSPLKLLCSGGRVRFRGRRPWSASSSAGTSCLLPP